MITFIALFDMAERRDFKEELKDHIHQNGVADLDKFLKSKLEEWRDVEINIAVTGDTGAGKSSFINAIRK